jgi:hypothetical protein
MPVPDKDLLPLTSLWDESGRMPDPGAEGALADVRARALWGLTDPARIQAAVVGYTERMHAARIQAAEHRPVPTDGDS